MFQSSPHRFRHFEDLLYFIHLVSLLSFLYFDSSSPTSPFPHHRTPPLRHEFYEMGMTARDGTQQDDYASIHDYVRSPWRRVVRAVLHDGI